MLLRFFIDPATGEPHIAGHNVSEDDVEDILTRPIEDRPGSEGCGSQGTEGAATPAEEIMKATKYPAGWDEARVRRVLDHYEQQTDEEAVAEDEAAYESTTHTVMEVPVELVPAVRELLAKRRAS